MKMASIRKVDILVFAVLFTVCIMVCSGAPSNSTATNTKSPTLAHTRIQRSSNKTSSQPTTMKTPHGRSPGSSDSKTVPAPSPSKTLSRQTRNAPAGNASSSTNAHIDRSAPDALSTNNQHTGAVRRNSTSSFRRQQHSSVNGTSISDEPSSPVRPVPVRRVPVRHQPSTKNSEEPGTFVVSSHIPVRPLSAQNRNASTTVSGAKGSSNAAFIHHEEADH